MADIPIFDKLLKWYSAPPSQKEDEPLTDEEYAYLERLEFIDGLFRQHRPALKSSDIRNMTMERYKISMRQYYYDKDKSEQFFGILHKVRKEYMIPVQVEYYKQLRSLAELSGDYMAAVRASARIDKLLQLDTNDLEGGELQPTTIQIVLSMPGINDEAKEKVVNIDHLQKLPEEEFAKITEATNQLTITPEQVKALLEKKTNGGD